MEIVIGIPVIFVAAMFVGRLFTREKCGSRLAKFDFNAAKSREGEHGGLLS